MNKRNSIADKVRYLSKRGYRAEDVLMMTTKDINNLYVSEKKLEDQLLPQTDNQPATLSVA